MHSAISSGRLRPMSESYAPDPDRYDGRMPYRRCGRSGLKLPAVTIGCWHNFGDDTPLQTGNMVCQNQSCLLRSAEMGTQAFPSKDNPLARIRW